VGTPDVAGNGEPAPQNAGSVAPPVKAQAGPTPTLYAATPQVLGASQPPVITARPSQTPAIQSPLSQPATPTTGGFATAAANPGAPPTLEAQNQPPVSGTVPSGPAPSGTGSVRTPDILAVAPPPQQQAMLSPAMLRPALASALAATPCSFTAGTLSPQGVADIEGVGSGAAIGALHQAADAAAPGVTTQWALTDIDPSYCPALNVVRPLAPEFGTPRAVTLSLKDGKTALVTDDYILPTVSMPAYPAYLNVDYLVHDGTVVHLYPNKSDPSANDGHRLFPAHALVRMGLPNAREKFEGWQVYSPYGRDLIIVVASSVPLIGLRPVDPQSQSEATGPYLTALQAAIDAARKRDAKVTADAVVLDTAAKQ
jgi:hypothetical protein